MAGSASSEFQVRPTFVDAPSAPNLRAAGPLLEVFAATDLPVIAIHRAGLTIGRALGNIERLLPDGIDTGGGTSLHLGDKWRAFLPLANTMPQESSWHIDDHGRGDDWIRLNFHHTWVGKVEGRYLRAVGQPGALHHLDKALLERRGLVDTRKLEPRGWRTLSRPGTLVLFKAGLPLAHNFIARQRPRAGHLQIGRLTSPAPPTE